mmetsp:Transcript_66143/g.157865  ORF Transcript_66143/g.157865 Transcript_66143/m.157865 type:complete len:201 (-) Transcript_66143:757-1359(-)
MPPREVEIRACASFFNPAVKAWSLCVAQQASLVCGVRGVHSIVVARPRRVARVHVSAHGIMRQQIAFAQAVVTPHVVQPTGRCSAHLADFSSEYVIQVGSCDAMVKDIRHVPSIDMAVISWKQRPQDQACMSGSTNVASLSQCTPFAVVCRRTSLAANIDNTSIESAHVPNVIVLPHDAILVEAYTVPEQRELQEGGAEL